MAEGGGRAEEWAGWRRVCTRAETAGRLSPIGPSPTAFRRPQRPYSTPPAPSTRRVDVTIVMTVTKCYVAHRVDGGVRLELAVLGGGLELLERLILRRVNDV